MRPRKYYDFCWGPTWNVMEMTHFGSAGYILGGSACWNMDDYFMSRVRLLKCYFWICQDVFMNTFVSHNYWTKTALGAH